MRAQVINISSDDHFADYAELATPILPEPQPQPKPYYITGYDPLVGIGLAILASCAIYALAGMIYYEYIR